MDLIYAGRYTEICDYAWCDYENKKSTTITLPEGIWHVDTTAIPRFFQTINNMFNRHRQYTVVSPSCDYGVCLQQYNHPARDLCKWAEMQITNEYGYNDLKMAARLNKTQCNINDKYSIKCWSWTAATFPEIPENVKHWFLVNCDIRHPKVTAIPFGVFGNKNKLECANKINNYKFTHQRNKLLYVNFQFYTIDRYKLYTHLSKNFPELVTCKKQCSFDEFLDDLATHKFVLCPPGNGLDCYRTLESIYMGAIPILESQIGCCDPYACGKYPILAFSNLYMIDYRGLNKTYEQLKDSGRDLTKFLWPYWKNLIRTTHSSTG